MNGLNQSETVTYFFFFAVAFFFAGAFFFALEAPFFFIGMFASLLRSVARFEPLSSQAPSTSATHHPYAADYRGHFLRWSTDECHFGNFFLNLESPPPTAKFGSLKCCWVEIAAPHSSAF